MLLHNVPPLMSGELDEPWPRVAHAHPRGLFAAHHVGHQTV